MANASQMRLRGAKPSTMILRMANASQMRLQLANAARTRPACVCDAQNHPRWLPPPLSFYEGTQRFDSAVCVGPVSHLAAQRPFSTNPPPCRASPGGSGRSGLGRQCIPPQPGASWRRAALAGPGGKFLPALEESRPGAERCPGAESFLPRGGRDSAPRQARAQRARAPCHARVPLATEAESHCELLTV